MTCYKLLPKISYYQALPLLLISLFFAPLMAFSQIVASVSQNGGKEDSSGYTTVVAGPAYQKSLLHQWLWGKHYRKDWVTAVKVPVLNLDTVNGGLTVYQKGGGRQSKTLRLRNPNGKEYVLRSIDKSFGGALPEKYRGMMIEDIINDQVTIAEPYAAVTIPEMAEAAGVFHTNPQIVFIPAQKALGEFSKDFGNQLYLLEQRPDENWEEADNFGNSKNIVGTDKMLENLFEDNDNEADQLAFVRARLFDMFIGDWGRHEDQWRWATIKKEKGKLYVPIPRDRDQVYTKFDGALLSLAISAAGAGHLESFGNNIKHISTYNFPARNLDRRIANEPVKDQWIAIARELQLALTDEVIESAVKQLPPEVYGLSGTEIIEKLKNRRQHLPAFARDYYLFLAKEVSIVGTHDNELFSIRVLSPTETEVSVYDLDKEGYPKKEPFYQRIFNSGETQEINIYGLKGNDQYTFTGNASVKIHIRIIGGPDLDIYKGTGPGNSEVYDNTENDFTGLENVTRHLSSNPFVHLYNYEGFTYDKKGWGPILSYNRKDRIHVGLKYKIEKQQWRKYPFGSKQEIAARYSISERAFSFGYDGLFKKIAGTWDLHLQASYDLIRWNNFFGIGNETNKLTDDRDFYRVRSKEFYVGAGLEHPFSHYHRVGITAYYNTIDLLDDPERFLSKMSPSPASFDAYQFGGITASYIFQQLNDNIVPVKGYRFATDVNFMQNLQQTDSSATQFSTVFNAYFPLSGSFVFALKTGAATVTGKPTFFQLTKLGGSKTLRGIRTDRFYGKSMFYNQAELQFIRNVKTYLFSGKAGLIALYDIGRVWQPGESSTLWHHGYGGGIMLAPFNKFSIAVFYAVSQDENDFSLRFIRNL